MVEGKVDPSAAADASSSSTLPTSVNPLASPESVQCVSSAPNPQAAAVDQHQKSHDEGVEAEKSLAIAGEIIASVSSRERELEVREAELRAAIRNNYDKIQSVESELVNLRRGRV